MRRLLKHWVWRLSLVGDFNLSSVVWYVHVWENGGGGRGGEVGGGGKGGRERASVCGHAYCWFTCVACTTACVRTCSLMAHLCCALCGCLQIAVGSTQSLRSWPSSISACHATIPRQRWPPFQKNHLSWVKTLLLCWQRKADTHTRRRLVFLYFIAWLHLLI